MNFQEDNTVKKKTSHSGVPTPPEGKEPAPARRWADTVRRDEPDRLDAGSPEASYQRGTGREVKRPKALLLGLETGWLGVARLPRALQLAGFEVGVACRPGAFLAHTEHREYFLPLPERIYGSVIAAKTKAMIEDWRPDLVLPADDRTAVFLAGLHGRLTRSGGSGIVAETLKRSLGNPAGVLEAANKQKTLDIAAQLGIRAPEQAPILSPKDIVAFGEKHGFPVVLKTPFDSGGHGVVVCRSREEVDSSLELLTMYDSLKWRLSRWRDELQGRALASRWLPVSGRMTVSRFIEGNCGTSVVAAMEGKALSVMTAVREGTQKSAESNSVVRFKDQVEMRETSVAMTQHWGLTGLIGFDFMIDQEGHAWMIECNPRATPIAHLGNRVGEDVCNALFCALTSLPPRKREGPLPDLVVALYPQEIWRDPGSRYLRDSFHDVPLHDEELLKFIRQSRE